MVRVWDTSGQERFKSLASSFYRMADAIIVVYEVTSRSSFEKVSNWVSSANEMKNKARNVNLILVGNKIDLERERRVSKEEGEKFATSLDVPFFEVSAKDNKNIDELFEFLIQRFLNENNAEKNSKREVITLTNGTKDEKLWFYQKYCAIS